MTKKQRRAPVTAAQPTAPRINTYRCRKCGGEIITQDIARGMVPFTIACKTTPGCSGAMYSNMYRADQSLTPQWEWYAPDAAETATLTDGEREHVKMGGLLLRKTE